jgi:hypothetical protein
VASVPTQRGELTPVPSLTAQVPCPICAKPQPVGVTLGAACPVVDGVRAVRHVEVRLQVGDVAVMTAHLEMDHTQEEVEAWLR